MTYFESIFITVVLIFGLLLFEAPNYGQTQTNQDKTINSPPQKTKSETDQQTSSSTVTSQPQEQKIKIKTEDIIAPLSHQLNDAFIKLYQQLVKSSEDNFVFSPYALLELFLFFYEQQTDENKPAFLNTFSAVLPFAPNSEQIFLLRNLIWPRELPTYLPLEVSKIFLTTNDMFPPDRIQERYKQHRILLQARDLKTNAQELAQILAWSKRFVKGDEGPPSQQNMAKTTELAPPQMNTDENLPVIVFASKFHGLWFYQVKKEAIRFYSFQITPELYRSVPMIRSFAIYKYLKTPDFQLVTIPFENHEYSLNAVLMNDSTALLTWEQQINSEELIKHLQNTQEVNLAVYLPKFTSTTSFPIKMLPTKASQPKTNQTEKAQPKENSSAASTAPDHNQQVPPSLMKWFNLEKLLPEQFIIQTQITFNEDHAEPQDHDAKKDKLAVVRHVLRFDRPFFYFIHHHKSGLIVLMGKTLNPLTTQIDLGIPKQLPLEGQMLPLVP